MKKIILLPLALCAFSICGCQRSSTVDTATIDALNKKIDWLMQAQSVVMSNQIALSIRMNISAASVEQNSMRFTTMEMCSRLRNNLRIAVKF